MGHRPSQLRRETNLSFLFKSESLCHSLSPLCAHQAKTMKLASIVKTRQRRYALLYVRLSRTQHTYILIHARSLTTAMPPFSKNERLFTRTPPETSTHHTLTLLYDVTSRSTSSSYRLQPHEIQDSRVTSLKGTPTKNNTENADKTAIPSNPPLWTTIAKVQHDGCQREVHPCTSPNYLLRALDSGLRGGGCETL